jgi:PilZ domain
VEEILNLKSFPSAVNLRASPRYEFQVDIEIERRSKSVWGRVRNISREGMFIELADPPEPGAKFCANLSLNVPLRVICLVRRTVPQYGIGVSFIIPEHADKKRFEALLIALACGADPTATGTKAPQPKPDEPLLCFAAAATGRPLRS